MLAYFTVTVIIGFVERAANFAAAGTLVVGIECRLPARYTRRKVTGYLLSHPKLDIAPSIRPMVTAPVQPYFGY